MAENLKKGENIFLKRYEELHRVTIEESKKFPVHEKKEKIKQTIESIKKEIEDLPSFKSEISFHPTMPANQLTNLLAQAIQIAINDGVDKALKFIYQTGNPYLVDAFHDILIGHFIHLISNDSK
ncbi:MAG: hypothetical protein KatS3mg095_0579 [Candidatus Parcubacteria bacterium]|nr:MAG: hypothetical protein KatS3mg095_0579 [Candidatus Parcubacteria bacterium]